MHLQVRVKAFKGLRMMKYVSNQPFDFSNPSETFLVAFMQCMIALTVEIWCIFYMCWTKHPIEVVIRFVSFASIASIDEYYGDAFPEENKLKLDKNEEYNNFEIKVEKRDWKRVLVKNHGQDGYVSASYTNVIDDEL